MVKDIVFNQEVNEVLVQNAEIFSYEYPEIDAKTWDEFKRKPNCKCRGKIFDLLRKDPDKLNGILSKLMGEEVNLFFPSPIDDPIVKEFNDLKGMEDFLKELKSKGKMIRSATPSSNGKGGFIIIVM